ncbi:MAG: ribonuclease G [Thermodesulfobacteriota bacterium]|nr:MAG: ribonuclease G [Thermodesulfobacteriota bacterium]
MENQILINVTFNETRVAVMENGSVAELYIERKSTPRIVGNIYKGKVGKVVPGMQAAFIDIGMDKSGFISVEDVQEETLYEYFLDGSGDDAAQDFKKQQNNLIQDILREGQHLLVQVLKESVGGKGAKLSSYVAIPGKYLVLLGTIDIVGISRKIEDIEERERLTESINKIKPEGVGLIARTASTGITEEELEYDLKELLSIWKRIKNGNEQSKGPSLIYEEPKLYLKAVRDFVSNEMNKILVDSEEAYKEITDYLQLNFPDSIADVELYTDSAPLFTKFGVENEIKKIFKKKVWLKSGGHIIIEEAEGLTVVDVNTGRYQSGKDQEETIYNINVEAALEIVRQVRLRNLVGIVVIDFIDIKNRQLREAVYEQFVEALKNDRARSVVHEMSSFGVIQMTRQRLRESILKELAEPCFACDGIGYLKSIDTISYEIIRDIKKRLDKAASNKITVVANSVVIKRLLESEQHNLDQLVEQFSVDIEYKSSEERIEKYRITSN